MQLDEGRLNTFAANAWDGYIEALVAGRGLLEAAEINTPARLACFLGQCAHETGGFTILRERTNWTAEQICRLWPHRFKTKLDPRILRCRGDEQALANLAYADRADLGNLGDDDGWDYRGGGFLQLTGRAAYHEIGNAIGADLEGRPELIEDPHVSLKTALWIWTRAGLNRFADRLYVRAIGNAINRGNAFSAYDPIGAAQREVWTQRAWAIFGAGEPKPDPHELHLGAYGDAVGTVQARLRELGYGLGACDGVLGPTTARAIAAFKLDHKRDFNIQLEPDEIVGPLTHAALSQALPIQVSPERAYATPQALLAKGSTEVAAGMAAQRTGQLLTGVGLMAGAEKAGLLEGVSSGLQSVTVLKASLVPALDAVSWALKHWLFVVIILVGAWYWRTGGQVIWARVKAHIEGWNLSK